MSGPIFGNMQGGNNPVKMRRESDPGQHQQPDLTVLSPAAKWQNALGRIGTAASTGHFPKLLGARVWDPERSVSPQQTHKPTYLTELEDGGFRQDLGSLNLLEAGGLLRTSTRLTLNTRAESLHTY